LEELERANQKCLKGAFAFISLKIITRMALQGKRG